MFVQNNFESWPHQPCTSTDLIFFPHNHHNTNHISHLHTTSNNNINNYTDTDSINSLDFEEPILEFDFDLSNEILSFQLEQEACVEVVSPEDSLKSVMDEIESISSTGGLLFDDLSLPSPSENSLLDQKIVSPVSNNVVPESSESSGDETVGDSSLKKVRSGRVNKKESNKMAAGRYRAKKLKERDVLFKECDDFEVKNGHLKEKISNIELEIKCIKNLLVLALNTKKL